MTSEIIRQNITFSSEKQVMEFKKFQHDAGYGSFSQMARDSILKNKKRFYSKKSEEAEKLQDTMCCFQDNIKKNYDSLNERVELILMKINKEGYTSKVGQAMHDILKLLIQKDIDHSELVTKCKKYNDKTLDKTISLLHDGNIIGIKRKK